MNIIFLTDLDGTMLSHDNFSCDSIKNDIINLLESGIIIIFNSSKTRKEIENISKSFGVIFPYICENGGEFILPELQANEEKNKLYNLKLGKEIEEIQFVWDTYTRSELKNKCKFIKDMEVYYQSKILGIKNEFLDNALARQFSLPFLFEGSNCELESLRIDLKKLGLNIKKGGRVHNLSADHDKNSYFDILRNYFKIKNKFPRIVGFGDHDNDREFLESSDVACIIKQYNGAYLNLINPPKKVFYSESCAPTGWVEEAYKALDYMNNYILKEK